MHTETIDVKGYLYEYWQSKLKESSAQVIEIATETLTGFVKKNDSIQQIKKSKHRLAIRLLSMKGIYMATIQRYLQHCFDLSFYASVSALMTTGTSMLESVRQFMSTHGLSEDSIGLLSLYRKYQRYSEKCRLDTIPSEIAQLERAIPQEAKTDSNPEQDTSPQGHEPSFCEPSYRQESELSTTLSHRIGKYLSKHFTQQCEPTLSKLQHWISQLIHPKSYPNDE
jgi:hypothetical protein